MLKSAWTTFADSTGAMIKSFISDLRPHKVAIAMWQCAGEWNPTSSRMVQTILLAPVTILALAALLATWNIRSNDRKVIKPMRRYYETAELHGAPAPAGNVAAFLDEMHELRHGAAVR